MKNIPFIEGKKCYLSVIENEHIDFLIKLRNNPKVRFYMANRFPINSELMKEYVSKAYKNKEILLLIVDKRSEKLAGLVQLGDYNWPNGRAMLAIVIDPEFQGKGLGKEATELILDHAFNTLGLRKICLEVYEFNKRAIELYKKSGFKVEGKYKNHSLKDGKYYTLYFMTLLKRDFNKQ